MSVRNAIVLLLALSTLTLLVGCGSSSPTVVPPPSGGFTTSDLSGTYVFSSTGTDSVGDFITMVGSVVASGGNISSGTVDIYSADILAAAQPITGGNYSITADGRGQLNFNTTVLTATSTTTPVGATFTLDFVLTSSAHGLVTEYDSNGTGSGTIDLQSTVSQAQLAGSFAFGVSGVGNTTSESPIGAAGAFTLGDTGVVTAAGTEDINNDGLFSTGSITTASSVSVGTSPGIATIVSSLGTTYAFDVYPIDNTHFKLIQTDGLLFTSGDAYTQATAISNGQLVFTAEGLDSSGLPIAEGGWLTNSAGTISAGLEDFNDGGSVNTATTIGGGFGALTGGRSTLTLSGFVNGAASAVPGTYTFAAYPFTFSGGSGIQLLEIDDAGITSGVAYPQTSTALAASQGYGLNLSGLNLSNILSGSGGLFEEDDIAEFTTTSSGFSGIVDFNDEGTLTPDKALTGTYPAAVDSNGRGTVTTNYFNYNFYVIDGDSFVLLEVDTTQVGQGTFEMQTTPSASGLAHRVASLLRPPVRSRSSIKRKNP
jgi:autotransporter family porin